MDICRLSLIKSSGTFANYFQFLWIKFNLVEQADVETVNYLETLLTVHKNTNCQNKTAVCKLKCSPQVGQCGIIKIYRKKFQRKGSIFMPKGKPNKRYTPEFKIMVVETMQKEKLSYSETSKQFEINSHNRVQHWERIYLEEGKEGFYIERRGRKSTGRPPKLDKKAEEDLIGEVQRLRAEVAYLKN